MGKTRPRRKSNATRHDRARRCRRPVFLRTLCKILQKAASFAPPENAEAGSTQTENLALFIHADMLGGGNFA